MPQLDRRGASAPARPARPAAARARAPPATAASAQPSGSASVKTDPGQQRDGGRHHQRAAQVVAHLPQPSASMPKRRRAQHQRQQLPVAARPAVQARGGDAGMVRMVLDQHHVARPWRSARPLPSSRSWLSTASSGRRRSSTACTARTLQQALAGERAGAEQVLVDVGAAAAVGVEAALAGEHPVERRALLAAREGRDDRAAAGCRSRPPRAGGAGRSAARSADARRSTPVRAGCRAAGRCRCRA